MANKANQRERFEEAARELGVELDEERLKALLRQIGPADAAPSTIAEIGADDGHNQQAKARDR